MKVLLLHPQLKKYKQPRLPPLGLLSIAAVLEKEGHQVFVLDLNVEPNNLERFLRKRFDLVGITATTPLIKEAWRLTKICKRRKLPVILGGPHPSALPEESLKKGIVDIVVRHEGEETMKELCAKWPKYQKIAGISYIKNGKVVHNPNRPLIQNLDSLPFPAHHLLGDISRYSPPQPVLTKQKKTLTLISSRGCPYHCNYCYKGVFGDRWRAHSPEYILNLWEYLVKEFGVEEIGVEDDTFNLDPKRVEAICAGLGKRKN
ncbi:MAG: B12-binding domain-containing radical SAM protein [Patescibacteria group bacterium]